MDNKNNNKSRYKGDGKSLYNAVSISNFTVPQFYQEMGISRGTLYNYYESEYLDYSIKLKASQILKRTIEDVFDQIYIDTGTLIGNKVEDEQEKYSHKTDTWADAMGPAFQEVQEIEMRIIAYNLACFMMNGNESDYELNRTKRIRACRRDAHEYYRQLKTEPILPVI